MSNYFGRLAARSKPLSGSVGLPAAKSKASADIAITETLEVESSPKDSFDVRQHTTPTPVAKVASVVPENKNSKPDNLVPQPLPDNNTENSTQPDINTRPVETIIPDLKVDSIDVPEVKQESTILGNPPEVATINQVNRVVNVEKPNNSIESTHDSEQSSAVKTTVINNEVSNIEVVSDDSKRPPISPESKPIDYKPENIIEETGVADSSDIYIEEKHEYGPQLEITESVENTHAVYLKAPAAIVRPEHSPSPPLTPSNNNIDIKIGKIDLEIHQPAKPAPKPPAPVQPRQAAASAPAANNLSRYYLRGGFG